MVHHYLEEERPDREESTSLLVTPSRTTSTLRVYHPAWCSTSDNAWVVAHRQEIERIHSRLFHEVWLVFGPSVAQHMHILDTASLLQAAAETTS